MNQCKNIFNEIKYEKYENTQKKVAQTYIPVLQCYI